MKTSQFNIDSFFTPQKSVEEILDIVKTNIIENNLSKKKYKGRYEFGVQLFPITRESIIISPIPQILCLHCGFYGRTWHCPPYVPKYYKIAEKLDKFNTFILCIIMGDPTKRIKEDKEKFGASDWCAHYYGGNEINSIMKHSMNTLIKTLNTYFQPISTDTMPCNAGGGCTLCRVCTLHEKKKCKYPDDSHPSPEALGIDLYSMLHSTPIQIPPLTLYMSIGLLAANVNPEYLPSNPITLTRPKHEERIPNFTYIQADNALDLYNPDLYESCTPQSCNNFSPLLCNKRKDYREPDIKEWLRTKKLYTIKLNSPTTDLKSIRELRKYTLDLHRKGYWDVFGCFSHPCGQCEICDLQTHSKGGGYKIVQNRAIPRCIRYFNIEPPIIGDNVAYILL